MYYARSLTISKLKSEIVEKKTLPDFVVVPPFFFVISRKAPAGQSCFCIVTNFADFDHNVAFGRQKSVIIICWKLIYAPTKRSQIPNWTKSEWEIFQKRETFFTLI